MTQCNKDTKTFIIGALGFIGHHFLREYGVFGTQHKFPNAPLYFDLKHSSLEDLPIQDKGYTHAIIAAAASGMAFCEQNPQETHFVNVTQTLNLALKLIEQGITPILFSTAYVFDGNEGNYTEKSPVSPLNVYGAQKAELEKLLEQHCKDKYLMFRLNKVFSLEEADATLFSEIINQFNTREILYAAYDQIFAPISIQDLIHIVRFAQQSDARGLFNLCGENIVNRYDVTMQIGKLLRKPFDMIQRISLDDLPDKIARAKNTGLSCKKVYHDLGAPRPKPLEYYLQKSINIYSHMEENDRYSSFNHNA